MSFRARYDTKSKRLFLKRGASQLLSGSKCSHHVHVTADLVVLPFTVSIFLRFFGKSSGL